MAAPSRRIARPVIFICDIQEKFRNAIYQYPQVINTTQKVLSAAKILSIPVIATTQLRAKLGETCADLRLDTPEGVQTHLHADKSRFSMWTPEVQESFRNLPGGEGPREIAIVGIESHICVTQTTLDLLSAGHKVYILADGVSSCNAQEVPIALDRLRKEGATITTSESWMYEVMGDAAIPEFREMSGLVKQSTAKTKEAMSILCSLR